MRIKEGSFCGDRVVPRAIPLPLVSCACCSRLARTPQRSQRTDHRHIMADSVDDASIDNDRKPCPPSPSPSPDANECTGAFIRLLLYQTGQPLTHPVPISIHTVSTQNKHYPENENERSLSSLLRPEMPPAQYVFFASPRGTSLT